MKWGHIWGHISNRTPMNFNEFKGLWIMMNSLLSASKSRPSLFEGLFFA